MKILKIHGGSLTNFEVLDFLRSRGASDDASRLMSSVTPTEFKVYDYLVKTPACNQTRETICEFAEKSKAEEFRLSKAEVFNIINIRPSCAGEIAPIIEWDDSRDLEEKIDDLVEMVVQVLPPGPSTIQQNAEEEQNAEDAPAADDSAEATDDKENNEVEQMEET